MAIWGLIARVGGNCQIPPEPGARAQNQKFQDFDRGSQKQNNFE